MTKLAIVMLIFGWSYVLGANVHFEFKHSEPAFKEYVNTYYTRLAKVCPEKMKYQVNYYTIRYTYDDHDWIGLCSPDINGFTIDIDYYWWQKASLNERQNLIFHELSHCSIYRDHVDDIDNYMYPTLMNIPESKVLTQLTDNMVDYCNDR